MTASDEQLLARLRDLSLVDVDALLAGVPSERHAALLDAHAAELADALAAARERARALMAAVAAGPDPLGAAMRAREGGAAAGERATGRLTVRAHDSRALARLYDLAAHLMPRLIEVERRRASLS